MYRLQPIYPLVPLHHPTITGSHAFSHQKQGVPVDFPCIQSSETRPVEAQLLALGLQPAALLAAMASITEKGRIINQQSWGYTTRGVSQKCWIPQ